MGTLQEVLCTFMVISDLNLLRMRSVLDECCRENIIMFNNIFQEILPFKR